MTPLRPKLLLTYLTTALLGSNSLSARKAKKPSFRYLQQAAPALIALTSFFTQSPALAVPIPFNWGTGGGNQRNWPNGSTTQTYLVGGTTITFTFTTGGGATFVTSTPGLGSDPGGVRGFQLTGGLPGDNLFVNYDSPSEAGTIDLTMNFLNAAGQPVPVENLRYTVIDVDRDNNRQWQDVISVAGRSQSTGGTNVTPTVVGALGETVENITNNATAIANGIGYTPFANALTFRGITDPTSENTADALDVANIEKAGVEADNLNLNGNASGEGGITLNYGSSTDQVLFRYGNGRAAAGANDNLVSPNNPALLFNAADAGQPFDLPADPGAHGIGFISDFTFEPGIIGVRKQVTNVTRNPDGTVTATYTVGVTNLGEVVLSNVQLDDHLTRAVGTYEQSFGNLPAGGVTISNLTSTDLTVNPSYNGEANPQLLQAGGAANTLALGQTKSLTYNVTFNPGATTQFNSQVVATGTTPTGGITRDRSNDGATFDSTPADSDPTAAGPIGSDLLTGAANFNATTGILTAAGAGDDTVTSFIIPPPGPQIGITKQVLNTTPVPGQPGAYDVTFRQIIRNVTSPTVAEDNLNNVKLQETLNSTFRVSQLNGVGGVQVLSLSSPAASPIPGAPGTYRQFQTVAPGAINPAQPADFITTTGNSLPDRQDYSVVDFVVRITPQPNVPIENQPPFEGQATTLGTPTLTGVADSVTDLSDDVTNVPPGPAQLPDPTNIGSAGGGGPSQPIPAADPAAATNQNNRTPLTFTPPRPEIGVTKQVTNVVDNGNGSFRVTYRQIVRNVSSSAIDLNNVRLVDQPLNSVYRVGSGNGATSATYVPGSLRIGPNPGPAGYRGNPVINGAGFNGTDNGGTGLDLLQTTGNTLAQGEYFVVDYDVTVVPGENLGDGPSDPPYEAQVRALGSNAAITVTDLSDDVTNFPLAPLPPEQQLPRDLNANGTASDSADGQGNPIPGLPGEVAANNTPSASENNTTPVSFSPVRAAIFKSITQIGNLAITAPLPPQVPGAPAGSVGVVNVPSATPPVSAPAVGELFNYTLYFQNLSTQPLFNFEICDNLPPEVEFDSFISANGTFLRELTDLPRPNGQGASCTDLVTGRQLQQTGPSGAVLFNLGTLAPGQSGGVTFRVRRIR